MTTTSPLLATLNGPPPEPQLAQCYKLTIVNIVPIGLDSISTYYLSLATDTHRWQTPQIHGSIQSDDSRYPFSLNIQANRVDIAFHRIDNAGSGSSTVTGSSSLLLMGQQGKQEFLIFGTLQANRGKKVAEVELQFHYVAPEEQGKQSITQKTDKLEEGGTNGQKTAAKEVQIKKTGNQNSQNKNQDKLKGKEETKKFRDDFGRQNQELIAPNQTSVDAKPNIEAKAQNHQIDDQDKKVIAKGEIKKEQLAPINPTNKQVYPTNLQQDNSLSQHDSSEASLAFELSSKKQVKHQQSSADENKRHSLEYTTPLESNIQSDTSDERMRQNLSVTYADNSQNSSLSGESRPLENHFKKQSLKKVNPEITIRPKLLTIEELPREYAPSVSIPLKSLDWEGQVPSKVNWQAMENIPKQTSFAEGNTQDRQIIRQFEDTTDKWYKSTFGINKPYDSEAEEPLDGSRATQVAYEKSFEYLNDTNFMGPHYELKNIMSTSVNKLKSIQLFALPEAKDSSTGGNQLPRPIKIVQAISSLPFKQWPITIRLPLLVAAFAFQVKTEYKSLKGVISRKSKQKCVSQLYDSAGMKVGSINYTLKQVQQTEIQTVELMSEFRVSEAPEEEQPLSHVDQVKWPQRKRSQQLKTNSELIGVSVSFLEKPGKALQDKQKAILPNKNQLKQPESTYQGENIRKKSLSVKTSSANLNCEVKKGEESPKGSKNNNSESEEKQSKTGSNNHSPHVEVNEAKQVNRNKSMRIPRRVQKVQISLNPQKLYRKRFKK